MLVATPTSGPSKWASLVPQSCSCLSLPSLSDLVPPFRLLFLIFELCHRIVNIFIHPLTFLYPALRVSCCPRVQMKWQLVVTLLAFLAASVLASATQKVGGIEYVDSAAELPSRGARLGKGFSSFVSSHKPASTVDAAFDQVRSSFPPSFPTLQEMPPISPPSRSIDPELLPVITYPRAQSQFHPLTSSFDFASFLRVLTGLTDPGC